MVLSILQFGPWTQKLLNPIQWNLVLYMSLDLISLENNKLLKSVMWESYSFHKFVPFTSLDPISWSNIVATPFQPLFATEVHFDTLQLHFFCPNPIFIKISLKSYETYFSLFLNTVFSTTLSYYCKCTFQICFSLSILVPCCQQYEGMYI